MFIARLESFLLNMYFELLLDGNTEITEYLIDLIEAKDSQTLIMRYAY